MKEAPKNISISLGIIAAAYMANMAKSDLRDVLYGVKIRQTFDATPIGFDKESHDNENGGEVHLVILRVKSGPKSEMTVYDPNYELQIGKRCQVTTFGNPDNAMGWPVTVRSAVSFTPN